MSHLPQHSQGLRALLNPSGVGGAFFLGASCVFCLLALMISQYVDFAVVDHGQQVRSSKNQGDLEALVALGGYLVVSGPMACREEGLGGENLCQWIGPQESQPGGARSFGLSRGRPLGKRFLFDVLGQEGDPPRGEISFELLDARSLSHQDTESQNFDQDPYAVLVRATLSKTRKAQGLVRRPLAQAGPSIQIDQPLSCQSTCPLPVTENEFPSCRGDLELRGNIQLTLSIKNEGPGNLYGLAYQKVFNLGRQNQQNAPNFAPSFPQALQPQRDQTFRDQIQCRDLQNDESPLSSKSIHYLLGPRDMGNLRPFRVAHQHLLSLEDETKAFSREGLHFAVGVLGPEAHD